MRVFDVIQQWPEVVCSHSRQTSCCPSPGRPQIGCESCSSNENIVRHVPHGSADWWSADRITRCLQSLSCPWCHGRTFQVLGVLTRAHPSAPKTKPWRPCDPTRAPHCGVVASCSVPSLCVLTLRDSDHLPSEKILESGTTSLLDVAATSRSEDQQSGQQEEQLPHPFTSLVVLVQLLFHGQSHCAVIRTSQKLRHRLHDHFMTIALVMNTASRSISSNRTEICRGQTSRLTNFRTVVV